MLMARTIYVVVAILTGCVFAGIVNYFFGFDYYSWVIIYLLIVIIGDVYTIRVNTSKED